MRNGEFPKIWRAGNNRPGIAGLILCALFLLLFAAAPRAFGQVLPPARLVSPPDSSINQPTTVTFAWRAVVGATTYQFEVSDTPLFTSVVYQDSLITGQSATVDGLQRNTTYFWRVRAQNFVDAGQWSDTWRFSTVNLPPPAPDPSSPPDGAAAVPTSVTLSWGATPRATSYRVQLSTIVDFSALILDDSTVVSTSRLVQGLQNNTLYYWRVSASNAGGTSAWSASPSFTTVSAPPAAPSLSSPPNGAADQPVTLTLNWLSTPGAASYYLQVSTGSGFATLTVDDSTLTGISRSVGPLANGTIYYWRVSAKNSGGQSAWSNTWYFATVPGAPAPPALSSPVNGAASQPTSVTLIWTASAGAASYRVQVSANAPFTSLTLDDSGFAATNHQAGPLANNTTYYWRVSAQNSGGSSGWSSVWSFTTGSAAPPAPTLLSPANNSINQPVTITLSWNAAAGALRYRLQVSTSPAFATSVFDDSTITGASQAVGSLADSTTYYWRVSGLNGSAAGPWSAVWNFLTAPAPTAATKPPTGVDATSATFQGVVNPKGISTQAKFEFGTTTAYGSAITAVESPVAGTNPVNVSGVIRGLSPSTQYHYKLVAFTGARTVEGGDVAFLTLPDQVALVSPPNGSVNQPSTLTLSWGSVAGADAYRLQLSTNSSFGTPAVDDSGVVSPSRSVGPLANNTTYYWHVCARNSAGWGSWSVSWSFTILPATPGIPTLVSPANASVDQPTTLTVQWRALPAVNSYRLQVSVDSLFVVTVLDDSLVTDTLRQVGSLTNKTKYFWRVRAKNAAGAGGWSGIWSFTTVPTLPGPPGLVAPPNGASNVPTTVNLSWNGSTGATSYRVQVSTNPTFPSPSYDTSGITTTSTTVSGLLSSTTYYWRVDASNAAGTTGWSAVWGFTTVRPAPSSPVLQSPPNNSTTQPTTLVLAWSPSAGASGYRLQLSVGSAFTTTVVDDSSITDTSRQAGPLLNGTAYYWRVLARNAGGSSNWSATWTFTTAPVAPGVPTLVSPTNGAINQPSTLTLTWNSAAGAVGYWLQLATSPAFTSIIRNDSLLTATAEQVGPLADSTTYFWRVRARNTGGLSDWSNSWQFATAQPAPLPPSPPALASPANGATNQPISLTLMWTASSGAASYHLQVSASPSFSPLVLEDSSIAGTSRGVGPLSNSTAYYWRASARNAGGASGWSPRWSFTTIAPPPPPPDLSSPPNGSTYQPTNVGLQWSSVPGASVYRLQVARTTGFALPFLDDSSITGTSRQISSLASNTIYYWRVSGRNAGTWGDWSQTWGFATGATPVPPTLSSPPNGAINQPISPTLSWNSSLGATSYEVQVSTTASFNAIVEDDSLLTGTSRIVGPLSHFTAYYWRVRAQISALTSDWSDVWTFTTTPGASAPTAVTGSAASITMTSATLTGSVNPNGRSTSVKFQYGSTQTYGSEMAAAQSPVTGTATVTVSAGITGLSANSTYHYRVVAQSDSGLVFGADMSFKTLSSSYPSTFTLSATVQYPSYSDPGQFKAADYRLVGLPGAGNAPVSSSLPGSAGSDWQAYWDNGAPSNYLVQFDGSSTFRFTVGRAFWIIKNGSWNVSGSVPTAPLDSAGNAQIPLHSAWNLITNPFTSPVTWSAVQSANGATDPIYAFNGTFVQASSFDPYVGYYFFNSTNIAVLKIPYRATSSGTAKMREGEWRVNIALVSESITDRAAWFGISRQAMSGFDPLDFRKPAGITAGSGLSFQRPEWDPLYSSFATDVRPEISDVETWPFDVRAVQGQSQHLRFSGVRTVPANLEIYLVDEERGAAVNLRDDSVYTFVQKSGTMKLEIIVGKEDAMKLRLNSIRPRMFVLDDNYPNPFNPTTSLSVGIPAESGVSLGIFDMLGHQVRNLYNGTLKPGRYAFTWDGKDAAGSSLASGTYFSRLLTDRGVILTKKMILLK